MMHFTGVAEFLTQSNYNILVNCVLKFIASLDVKYVTGTFIEYLHNSVIIHPTGKDNACISSDLKYQCCRELAQHLESKFQSWSLYFHLQGECLIILPDFGNFSAQLNKKTLTITCINCIRILRKPMSKYIDKRYRTFTLPCTEKFTKLWESEKHFTYEIKGKVLHGKLEFSTIPRTLKQFLIRKLIQECLWDIPSRFIDCVNGTCQYQISQFPMIRDIKLDLDIIQDIVLWELRKHMDELLPHTIPKTFRKRQLNCEPNYSNSNLLTFHCFVHPNHQYYTVFKIVFHIRDETYHIQDEQQNFLFDANSPMQVFEKIYKHMFQNPRHSSFVKKFTYIDYRIEYMLFHFGQRKDLSLFEQPFRILHPHEWEEWGIPDNLQLARQNGLLNGKCPKCKNQFQQNNIKCKWN